MTQTNEIRAAQPVLDRIINALASEAYSYACALEAAVRDADSDELERISRREIDKFKAKAREILVAPVAAPAQPVARNWPAINAAVEEFISEYELRGDPGDHTPTEFERFMLTDAVFSLLDTDFVDLLAARQPVSGADGLPSATGKTIGDLLRDSGLGDFIPGHDVAHLSAALRFADMRSSAVLRDFKADHAPLGAILNGRVYADRIESTGLECEAGPFTMCNDWVEFRRCFEALADWAMTAAQPQPSGNAQDVEDAARYRWLRDRNDWHAEPRLDETDGTVWRLTFYTPAPIIDPTDDDNLDTALIAAMLADASGCRPQAPANVKQPLAAQPSGNAHPIPQSLRDAFSKIEDCSPSSSGMQVFTQMRTAVQSHFQATQAVEQPSGNAQQAQPVAARGVLSFDPGTLHIDRDGSGRIVVGEAEFALEDDRGEGPDGPRGSVHWVTRLSVSEVAALRDFLNANARPTDDQLWEQTLSERDEYHDMADKLANAIADHLLVEIGEHTSSNCPWMRALDAIENAAQASGQTVEDPLQPAANWLVVGANLTATQIAGDLCIGINRAQRLYDAARDPRSE